MSGWDDDLVDSFLADVGEDAALLAGALAGAESGTESAPRPSLKAEILGAVSLAGRFDRFAEKVAELLDVKLGEAKGMLDRVHEAEIWKHGLVPDVSLYDVDGGPRVENAITGFVRMPQGTPFPEHAHLGTETALIIQGSAVNERGELWQVGDVVEMGAGSSHSFQARPGPDLLFLVVVEEGLTIGDLVLGPDSPEI